MEKRKIFGLFVKLGEFEQKWRVPIVLALLLAFATVAAVDSIDNKTVGFYCLLLAGILSALMGVSIVVVWAENGQMNPRKLFWAGLLLSLFGVVIMIALVFIVGLLLDANPFPTLLYRAGIAFLFSLVVVLMIEVAERAMKKLDEKPAKPKGESDDEVDR